MSAPELLLVMDDAVDALSNYARLQGRQNDRVGQDVSLLTRDQLNTGRAAVAELLEALRALVKVNEEHNAACEAVIGRPLDWKDSYLDAARAAIAKATGGDRA